MKDFFTRLAHTIRTAERAVAAHTLLWGGLLCLLAVFTFMYALPARSGDWYRSGNDMVYILPPARAATPTTLLNYLHGPWIGAELFVYYRPVTSVLWVMEFRAFGENAAAWQMISLAMHTASVVMLALLLRRVFGLHFAALVAAGIWATRAHIIPTLEWTPAQTDHFAGFFGLAALLCLQTAIDTERHPRRIIYFVVAGMLCLLAMGSKEIAYTVPLLAVLLVFHNPDLARPVKIRIAVGIFSLLMAFICWRFIAMHGLGFIPGQASAGRANASPFTLSRWAYQMANFLLPMPLTPMHSPLASVTAAFTLLLLLQKRPPVLTRPLVRFALASVGIMIVLFLLGGPEYLMMEETYSNIAVGVLSVALIGVLVWGRFQDALFVAAWGLIAYLPLYHVVYNAAGNVTYLPGIYWAFAWAALLSVLHTYFLKNYPDKTGIATGIVTTVAVT